jgi:DNA-binding HxlR family transcriptional regulator
MAGYGQFCPVAQALEIVGELWTLLIVRELLCGSTRFGEIHRGVPLMGRSMLAQRLRSLCDAGVVERAGGGYRLTEAGLELRTIVMECGRWGATWARRRLRNADVDVALLVWDMRRRIDAAAMPEEPVLVRFEFEGAPPGKRWFYLDLRKPDVDLCLANPGREVDLEVRTTPRAMAEVWMGHTPLDAALRAGALRLEGPRPLVRAFPGWLKLSVFADAARAAGPAPAAKRAGA